MKVIPKRDYKLLGTDIRVTAGKVYDAVPASNQPDYKEKGKIFITNAENDVTGLGFLFETGEYTGVLNES